MAAVPRPGWTPGGSIDDLAQWFDQQRQANPNYALPAGYKVHDGHVERDNSSWSTRLGQIASLAGMGMMGYGGAALAFPALAGGAGTAGAGGLVGSGEATIGSTAIGGTAPTIAGTAGGAAAAGGGLGMNASTLAMLGQLGLSAYGAARGNRQTQAPYSAEMEKLLGMQSQRMQQADPLYQAILRMAMGLLPTNARAGMGGAMPTPTPTLPRGGTLR